MKEHKKVSKITQCNMRAHFKIKTKNFLLYIIGPVVILAFFSNIVFAKYRSIDVFLKDALGNPITTAQDIRISLWDAYDERSEDIDGSSNINVGAVHYGDYQTTILNILPDDAGLYEVSTDTLTAFPDPVGQMQSFLQVEFKAQGTANTNYQIHDFVDDPPWQNIDRILIDDVESAYLTFDAGPRTNYNTFTLDANNNTPANITLEFGETLAKTLLYDTATNWFVLNDRLRVDGDLYIPDGNYAQFEDNNAGVPTSTDCDASSELGRISIDTSNNRLYICNGATRGWDYINLID